MQKPKLLDKNIIAKSNHFSIEQLHLKFSNGNERYFERIHGRSNGAVVIVPFIKEDEFLLVCEYAAGVDRYELTFPKGIIDRDESSLDAANRELQEEIGYAAKSLKIIHYMTAAPGYWGAGADIILASDLYQSKLPGDEPEPLMVIPWKLKDYKSLLKRKDFSEARNIATLLLIKELLS